MITRLVNAIVLRLAHRFPDDDAQYARFFTPGWEAEDLDWLRDELARDRLNRLAHRAGVDRG